jgi:hypothetical protein
MILDVSNSHRNDLFRHQARKSLIEWHAQFADATRVETKGRRQNQIRPIGLKQVCGADIGLETLGNQGHNVQEGIGGFAAVFCEIGNFTHRQHMGAIQQFICLSHFPCTLPVDVPHILGIYASWKPHTK